MEALDQIFSLLSQERRRYALYFLEHQDGPVSVDAVARQLSEWETNPSQITIPEEKYERIKVELRHTDLPKAAEAEFIEYDPDEGVVEVTDASAEFKAIIAVSEIIEHPE